MIPRSPQRKDQKHSIKLFAIADIRDPRAKLPAMKRSKNRRKLIGDPIGVDDDNAITGFTPVEDQCDVSVGKPSHLSFRIPRYRVISK